MERRKDNKGRVLNDGETQGKDGRYRYQYLNILGERKAERYFPKREGKTDNSRFEQWDRTLRRKYDSA